jgi:FK506-binding nuclear protein
MGFFAQLIDKDPLELPIPDDYGLHLLQVCVDPEDEVDPAEALKPICLYIQTPNDDDEVAICVLNPSKGLFHTQLSLEFGPEDGPLTIRTNAGRVSLSGKWIWDDEDGGCCEPCCVEGGEEGEEDEDEEGDEDEEDDDEAPELVPIEDEEESEVEEPVKAAPASKKQKLNDATSQAKIEAKPAAAKAEKQTKKAVEEQEEESLPRKKDKQKSLKPWKVHPFKDEGIAVPEPKVVQKANGLSYTDFIVGKGEVPKKGSTVHILYEGLFPDGTLFDSRLKVKSPFSFRIGTGQAIKGMDLGMEGMKIGGAREIFVPSKLG